MKTTAQAPEKSLRRLVRYASYYRELAAAAIKRGEHVDGKVWSTEAMVKASLPPKIVFMPSGTALSSLSLPWGRSGMPSMVREFKGYRIAIYSPSNHFAAITPPDSNRVIDLKDRPPRSTVVEGPIVCFERAEAMFDSLWLNAGNVRE